MIAWVGYQRRSIDLMAIVSRAHVKGVYIIEEDVAPKVVTATAHYAGSHVRDDQCWCHLEEEGTGQWSLYG